MLIEMNRLPELFQLTEYLKAEMERRGWGLRTLAMKSDIAPATLSKLLNARAFPRAETIKAIANALEVDETYLFRLAGHINAPDDNALDPGARYLARRITNLPITLREQALDALGAQLDVIYEASGLYADVTRRSNGEILQAALRAQNEMMDLPLKEREAYLRALAKNDREAFDTLDELRSGQPRNKDGSSGDAENPRAVGD